jgi:SAM-dependent methyltransferase
MTENAHQEAGRPRYSYGEFFALFPDLYRSYQSVVDHPGTYAHQLETLGLARGGTALSIGSGEGELEARLASDGYAQVDVVEPNSDFLRSWHDRLSRSGLPQGRCVTHAENFQDYRPACQYDLVLSIHSWYAIGQKRDLLEKALSCVKPGGSLLVSIVTGRNLAEEIFRTSGHARGRGLFAEELSIWAEGEGFPHRYWVAERTVPIETLLSAEGTLTSLGKAFVGFAAFCPWEELQDAARENALRLIQGTTHRGQVVLDNGCLLFKK